MQSKTGHNMSHRSQPVNMLARADGEIVEWALCGVWLGEEGAEYGSGAQRSRPEELGEVLCCH